MGRRLLHLLLPVLLLAAVPTAQATGSLAVVVNARCGVAVMSRNEVINIFFGRYRQFFNGREARPARSAICSRNSATLPIRR